MGPKSMGPKLDQKMPIMDIINLQISDFILYNNISINLFI